MERMGIAGETAYAKPERIQLEQEHIHELIHQLGITSIDVTDKPIETSADQVIRIITRRFGEKTRQA
jgi:regulator of PEP synthase PpsR (kinase-PPPase family)